MYKINSIPISDLGIIAIRSNDSPIALSGIWDMPSRTGKTFHDWGNDQNGIEPYVLPGEIKFGGRDLHLSCVVRGADRIDILNKSNQLYNLFGSSLISLESDWGNFSVFINGAVDLSYIRDGVAMLEIPFREPIVDMSGNTPMPTNSGIGIDGISFDQLGITPISTSGQYNRPEPKNGEFTAYASEGYKVTTTGPLEISMKFMISGSNYTEFNNRIKELYSLFSKEGLRYITKDSDALRTFFVKDGFNVVVKQTKPKFIGLMDITITEIGAYTDWSFLMDYQGNKLTDINEQKIIII